MFNFLKLLNEMNGELPTTGTNIPSTVPVYNGTNGTTPTSPVNAKVSGSTDPSFNNSRATLANGEVTAASVTDYVNQAAEINDGVECVGFAVELDDGKLVKVYVNQTDAEGFEAALSDALGQGDELEDLLVNMADTFDIVDVVWPTPEASSADTTSTADASQTPADTATTEQTPADASTSADAVISQPETVAPESTSAAPTSDEAGSSEDTTGEDAGEKTQKTETGDSSGDGGSLSDAEAEFNSLYGDDTGSSGETDNTDKKASTEETSSTDTSIENSVSDETRSADDTASEPEQTDTGSDNTGETASTEGGESGESDTEGKKSKSKDDDDISVVIHPKKAAVAEGVEDETTPVEDETTPVEDETTPVDTTPAKESKWFKSIGLRGYDEFAMMISGITAKKLLAILGFGGVRAAMLSQFDGLVENLIVTGKKINSNPTAKKFFDTVWAELMVGAHHKSPDAENVQLAQEFLENIGVEADEKTAGGRKIKELAQFLAGVMKNSDAKIAIQGLNSVLTGDTQSDSLQQEPQKTPDNTNQEPDDDTHLDNFSDDDDDDDHLEEGKTIGKHQQFKRTHASFDAEMKSQHSQYRKWMSRDQQVELLNWYLSGSDVHVFDWHPANGSITPHLGKLQIFAQGDLSTGEQEIICLEKPAYVISH